MLFKSAVPFLTFCLDVCSIIKSKVLKIEVSYYYSIAIYVFFQIRNVCFMYLLFEGFYLFILDREEGRAKEREKNTNVWLPLTHPLLWNSSGPEPRHVP